MKVGKGALAVGLAAATIGTYEGALAIPSTVFGDPKEKSTLIEGVPGEVLAHEESHKTILGFSLAFLSDTHRLFLEQCPNGDLDSSLKPIDKETFTSIAWQAKEFPNGCITDWASVDGTIYKHSQDGEIIVLRGANLGTNATK